MKQNLPDEGKVPFAHQIQGHNTDSTMRYNVSTRSVQLNGALPHKRKVLDQTILSSVVNLHNKLQDLSTILRVDEVRDIVQVVHLNYDDHKVQKFTESKDKSVMTIVFQRGHEIFSNHLDMFPYLLLRFYFFRIKVLDQHLHLSIFIIVPEVSRGKEEDYLNQDNNREILVILVVEN